MTSPPARVPRLHQTGWLIELLTNLTLPSPIRVLAPPEWLLVAFANSAWSGQPPPLDRHAPHGYCVEFGGTIVLKSVIPLAPTSQKMPRALLSPEPARNLLLQVFRALRTAVGFILASAIQALLIPALRT